VHRVGRGEDAFAPPPWEFVFEDGTFHNRYDDPRADRGVPEEERFRVVYCATRAAGAYGETIATYRQSPRLLAELRRVKDDKPLDRELEGDLVPEDFRSKRVLGITRLSKDLRFADTSDGATLTVLRAELAEHVVDLGLDDFDLSAITSSQRKLSQEVARYIYELADEGHTNFAGIRYLSRLHAPWELWAIFYDRMKHFPVQVAGTIAADDQELEEAANILGVKIENSPEVHR
jgi:RES domain